MSFKELLKNHNIRIISLSQFFDLVGRTFIRTVFPAFFAALGLSPTQIGIVDSLDELPGIFSFLINNLIKKSGEKICLLYSRILVLLSPIFFFFSKSWKGIAIGDAFSATGRHIEHSISDSIAINSVEDNMKARVKSFLSMVSALAAILSPFLALFIMNQLGIRSVFIFSFLSFLIALLFVFKIKEKPFKFEKITFSKYKFLFLISFLFYLAIENEKFLYYTAKIDRGVSNATIALFVLIAGITGLLIRYPIGKIIDKAGYKISFIVLSLILALLFLFWGYTPLALLLIMFIAINAFSEAYNACYISYSASYIPASERSRMFISMISLGHLAGGISSIGSGLLWEYYGGKAVFFLSAVTCLIIMILVVLKYKKGPPLLN